MKTGCYIDGTWVEGEGERFESIDPATGRLVAVSRAATSEQTAAAVGAARRSFADWAGLEMEGRRSILERFAAGLEAAGEQVAGLISAEVGKPRWEAAQEVRSMIGKVGISVEALARRCGEFRTGAVVTRFRPHGVAAVLGPFNFPGHLPNGHIVPALLAGNTVVFKASEQAPAVAARTVKVWEEAGLPAGVLNLLQGGAETGRAVVGDPGIDGVFFTGSAIVGEYLRQYFATRPGKILALEMGGNNPLVVERVGDVEAAVVIAVQSAFLTAGQRCTCARRLIVGRGEWEDGFLDRLTKVMGGIVVGAPGDEPEPFMGPVISEAAARRILAVQESLVARGAVVRREARLLRPGTGLLSPGLLDVTEVADREDEEHFGPLLQVIRVAGFEEAVKEANRTAYGLAAGFVSESRERWEQFRREVRAGVMNWNEPMTGASSAAPFGGVGRSGNFRPSAAFAADYCSWPVASMEAEAPKRPEVLPPGLSLEGGE